MSAENASLGIPMLLAAFIQAAPDIAIPATFPAPPGSAGPGYFGAKRDGFFRRR